MSLELQECKLEDVLLATREDAKASGSAYYFDGTACKRGHVAKRKASNGYCSACHAENVRLYRADNPDKARESNLASNARWRAKDPEAHRQRARGYYWSNAEKAKEQKRSERASSDKVQKRARERYAANPEPKRASRRRYLAKYPEAAVAHGSERRSAVRRATPKWMTREQKREISAFRLEARRLTKLTGILHSVDHIEPLRGHDACGLHVPWNMRVITQLENSRKGVKREG